MCYRIIAQLKQKSNDPEDKYGPIIKAMPCLDLTDK